MTSKLPAEDDWPALLDAAREGSLGLADGDAVPHGSLVAAVSDQCEVASDTADRWVENAEEKGWLQRRGTGANRRYVAAAGDAHLYDRSVLDEYLGMDDVEDAAIERALELAVEYYHEQLDDEHRWLIEGKWGIGNNTINDLQIGFVPSNNRLPAYLQNHDVPVEAALRAGVIRSHGVVDVYERDPDAGWRADDLPDDLAELAAARAAGEVDPAAISLTAVLERLREVGDLNLYVWWDARITFPYRDEEEDIKYLIARKTGQSDDIPPKYLKLEAAKPWVDDEVIFEPIYGCGTVEPGEDLILTEGITDAIRAHEVGYPCISPVTKGFKREHYDALLEYAQQADTAYLCFDSEESGVGLDGALRTAWFLQENGVGTLVSELPRGDRDDKVDLAEFLQEHDADDLQAVLNGAVAPDDHAKFDPVVHGDQEADVGGEDTDTGSDGPSGGGKSGSDQSALFDLDISDVVKQDSKNGVSRGYRGDNPISHVGDSHSGYFVYEQYKGSMRARDFKTDHTYTALTWLVCAAGERRTSNPGGSLNDDEIWAAWKYAKNQGMLADTDPIPWKARLYIAREHDLAPKDLINRAEQDPSQLPATIHNRILDTVEAEYAVNPGMDPLDTDDKAEQRAEYLTSGQGDDQEGEDKDREVKRMLATLDELDG